MGKPDKLDSTHPSEIESLRERLRSGRLGEGDLVLLDRLLGLLLTLISVVQEKNYSIKRLKRLLFGPRSDTRAKKAESSPATQSESEQADGASGSKPSGTSLPEATRRGHGRTPAARFTGAERVVCPSPLAGPKAPCPDPCCRGHLYDTKTPQIFIRRTGQPIVSATRYERQVLRCSACQTRVVAPLPDGVEAEHFDATADVAIGLYKYGTGLPWYRLERTQAAFGVPLPASTAFDRCERVADALLPVYLRLRELAASGELFYVDDTSARILACMAENKGLPAGARTAQYTTGIIAEVGARRIVVYETGRKYAGENLDDLLEKRHVGLAPPKQMSDALGVNWPKRFRTIVIKCLAHARREFVELEDAFPEPCARVLDDLATVYQHDEACRQQGLRGAARLAYHQATSGPLMAALRVWIDEWLDEQRRDEPNSRLGRALGYLRRHWSELTQFLHIEDAPLDNNLCERALKRAVLHRKNALFFKTQHGADVADIWMSLIETCRLGGVNPFDYLVAVVRNRAAARASPDAWLPWTYREGALEAA